VTSCHIFYRTWSRSVWRIIPMWVFKFSRRRVWCSELSSGIYCRVKWLTTIILHGSTTQKTALNDLSDILQSSWSGVLPGRILNLLIIVDIVPFSVCIPYLRPATYRPMGIINACSGVGYGGSLVVRGSGFNSLRTGTSGRLLYVQWLTFRF
jgi:hypothetical protein